MVATGLLRLDIAGYGGIAATDKGRALLRGDGVFRYRADTVASAAAAPQKPRAAPAETEHPLTVEETALLEALKALRLRLAKEQSVPAFVVFSDRSLIDMVRRRPRNVDDFAEVHGVGAAKLQVYAEPFLAAIADADPEAADPPPEQPVDAG